MSRKRELVNYDTKTIESFGDEWSRFDQSVLDAGEKEQVFSDYFRIFPWDSLPPDGGVGADVGCGSGRWAGMVAGRVRLLHCIDASSEALLIARKNLSGFSNVQFHLASASDIPVGEESLDFAFSLGVLHHVPDTTGAVRHIASKLKPGAPLLLYLYYSFDNRPPWYRWIWSASNALRKVVSGMPVRARNGVCEMIALFVYVPFARTARLIESMGLKPDNFPLAYYRDKSFYIMRTDARDRFGTSLEKRFSKEEICRMLSTAGLVDIRLSEQPPFWCAVGMKSR